MKLAYDRVGWEFLWAVLSKFGFYDTLIGWIKECVETVSFSVLVNHGPTEMFKPGRGLRQGNPLSPLLFILGPEILARRLQQETILNGSGIGFPITCRGGTKGPFLSFAYDIMIFAKATNDSCSQLRKLLTSTAKSRDKR